MKQLKQRIYWIEDVFLASLLLITVVLAGVDIIARSVFGGGIVWVPPLLRVLVLWLGLLGALLATRTNEHIAIDLVGRLAPFRVRCFLQALTGVFAALVCGLIAWHAQRFVALAHSFGDIAFAHLPAWPLQLIIPFSFSLMAVRFSIQSFFSIQYGLKGHAEGENA